MSLDSIVEYHVITDKMSTPRVRFENISMEDITNNVLENTELIAFKCHKQVYELLTEINKFLYDEFMMKYFNIRIYNHLGDCLVEIISPESNGRSRYIRLDLNRFLQLKEKMVVKSSSLPYILGSIVVSYIVYKLTGF